MLWWKFEISLHYAWLRLWFQYCRVVFNRITIYMFLCTIGINGDFCASNECEKLDNYSKLRLGSNIQCLFMNLNNLCAFLKKEMMVNWVVHLPNEFSYFPIVAITNFRIPFNGFGLFEEKNLARYLISLLCQVYPTYLLRYN